MHDEYSANDKIAFMAEFFAGVGPLDIQQWLHHVGVELGRAKEGEGKFYTLTKKGLVNGHLKGERWTVTAFKYLGQVVFEIARNKPANSRFAGPSLGWHGFFAGEHRRADLAFKDWWLDPETFVAKDHDEETVFKTGDQIFSSLEEAKAAAKPGARIISEHPDDGQFVVKGPAFGSV